MIPMPKLMGIRGRRIDAHWIENIQCIYEEEKAYAEEENIALSMLSVKSYLR